MTLPEAGILAAIKCPFLLPAPDSQPLSQCGSEPSLPWDSSVVLWHVHRPARALGSAEEGKGRALSLTLGKQAMAVLDPSELPVGLDLTAAASGSWAWHRAPRLSHSIPLRAGASLVAGQEGMVPGAAGCQEVANRQSGTGLFRTRLNKGGRLLLLACRGLDAARAAPGTTTGESPAASNPWPWV